jgi:enolase
MASIKNIKARQILDSRGHPTIECDIIFTDYSFGRAAVPSGSSKGVHEAIELRDNDAKKFKGMGVQKAIENILSIVKPKILDKEFLSVNDFDNEIIRIDGTQNKSKLGANSTLALSLAFTKALASQSKVNLYEFLSQDNNYILPVPMMNIINGGTHADNNVDIQEFMITPIGAPCFAEAIRYGCEIFYSLKSKLKSKGLNTNVGDEGGFAPDINSSKEVIELILESISTVGLNSNDIVLSLDVASTEFFANNKYNLKGEKKTQWKLHQEIKQYHLNLDRQLRLILKLILLLLLKNLYQEQNLLHHQHLY